MIRDAAYYKRLPPGNNVPAEVNAVVEIPKGQGLHKYEFRTSCEFVMDRVRKDLPLYPIHYCGIPATQAPDGDPLDVLIMGDDPFETGDVVAVRPVAVFWMSDEKGIDPKIIAVPATPEYDYIRTLADIPAELRQEIERFFAGYKHGDAPGKFSSSHGWDDIDVAHKTIFECIERWQKTLSAAHPFDPPALPGLS